MARFSVSKIAGLCALFMAVFALAPSASARSPQEPPAPRPEVHERGEKIFNAESFTLDNGLQVIVVPNNRAPVLTHMVWYKVGAANEPEGKSGIAHFLEHLMFKGSAQIGGADLAPGAFSKTIKKLGGQDNAFTSYDYTAYFQSVPSDKLETVMRMEAGRMRGLNPPENEVLSERDVILEERRQRTDNDPRALFGEKMDKAAFGQHPYGRPIIGWKPEMEKLDWDTAKAFYDLWYQPNNAILIVSGDVSPADVFSKAISIYGSIPARAVPTRAYRPSALPQHPQKIEYKSAAIRQPVVQILYRAPSLRLDKQASLALEVLAEILGGGPTSRLYKALVSEQKIASDAGLDYDSARWSDSSLWVYGVPVEGKKPEEIEKALKRELEKVAQHGVTSEELRDAIGRMSDAAIYARDSVAGPAMIIGRAMAAGASLDDVEYWADDLQSVTAAHVQHAAQLYLNPQHLSIHPPVTGYLLEDENATPEQRAAAGA